MGNLKDRIIALFPPILHSQLDRIKASPLGYRLATGAFWSLIGSMIARALQLIAFICVARILGKEGFGELGIIQSTVGMFGTFAGFGMGLTATKHIAEFRTKDPVRAGRIMALSTMVALLSGGVMAVALVALAPWLADKTLAAPHLAGVLQISAGLLFFTAIAGAQTGALAGFEAFRVIAGVNLLSGLLAFPLVVGGVYWGGVTGAVWGLVASTGANWLLNYLALRAEVRKSRIPYTLKGWSQEWRVLWNFSLPAVLAGAMVGPIYWACNALLVNQTGGYAELGVYTAVSRIKQAPELVLGAVLAPLLPVLSEQFGKKDVPGFNRTVLVSFAISCGIMVPFALIAASLPELLLLPYGSKFMGHPGLVQWLLLHSVLVGLFYPFGSILVSTNRMWFAWVYNVSWGVLFFLLATLLVPRYLASGLAAASSLTYLVTSLICVMYIYHYERDFMRDVSIGRLIWISLLFFGICAAVTQIFPLWLTGTIGILTTAIFLSLLHSRLRRKNIHLMQIRNGGIL